jgi:hypothetical protein
MKHLAALASAVAVLALAPSVFAGDKLYPDGTWQRTDETQEDETDARRRKPLPVVEVAKDPDSGHLGDRTRFRGGVSLLGGAYCLTDAEGKGSDMTYCAFLGGVEGRLGVQFNDFFGLYATPSFQLGGGAWDVVGRVSLGVMPELTFGDVLFIGLGPELFAADAAPDNAEAFEDQSHLGVRGRAGLAFGSKRPGRRHAFTLAADVRVDIFDDENVGVAPTLSLGYDAF